MLEQQIAQLILEFESFRKFSTEDHRSLHPIKSYSEKEKAALIKRFGADMILDWPDDWGTIDILQWTWLSQPRSVEILDYTNRLSLVTIEYCLRIDSLIQTSSSLECLTSTSEYIRECKKWMLQHPDMDFVQLLKQQQM